MNQNHYKEILLGLQDIYTQASQQNTLEGQAIAKRAEESIKQIDGLNTAHKRLEKAVIENKIGLS